MGVLLTQIKTDITRYKVADLDFIKIRSASSHYFKILSHHSVIQGDYISLLLQPLEVTVTVRVPISVFKKVLLSLPVALELYSF